jgi:hypothetical protein
MFYMGLSVDGSMETGDTTRVFSTAAVRGVRSDGRSVPKADA